MKNSVVKQQFSINIGQIIMPICPNFLFVLTFGDETSTRNFFFFLITLNLFGRQEINGFTCNFIDSTN